MNTNNYAAEISMVESKSCEMKLAISIPSLPFNMFLFSKVK